MAGSGAAVIEVTVEVGARVAAELGRYELHYEDESHLETYPYLCRVWHKLGTQPTLPVFGSVAFGGSDRAVGWRWCGRHAATGKEVLLVMDNGSAHTVPREPRPDCRA